MEKMCLDVEEFFLGIIEGMQGGGRSSGGVRRSGVESYRDQIAQESEIGDLRVMSETQSETSRYKRAC